MKSLNTLTFPMLLGALLFATPVFSQGKASTQTHTDSAPLNFVENQGQWHENVAYKTFFDGRSVLFIEDGGFTYLLTNPADMERVHDASRRKPSTEKLDFPIRRHAYRVAFIGGQNREGKGVAKRKAYHNYIIGNEPEKWASHVPMYGKILQKNIYEGINLETYSQQGRLKYDLLVRAGADVSNIKMRYQGADRLELENGNLHIHTSVQTITEMAPIAWQEVDGQRLFVACNYVLDGDVLSFDFPDGFDPTLELVIDPTVVGATLSGSNSENFGHTATFDNAGNIYAGGISFGSGYPTTTGAFQTTFGGGGTDICLSKYETDGSDLIFATYIGGSSEDYPHSLVTDFNQQLYVYGSSRSPNYPTSTNAVQSGFGGNTDIVVSILSPDGSSLVGSSYFGGVDDDGINESILNSNYGDAYRGEIVLDNQNNVYVVSSSSSLDFPVTAGAFDESKGDFQDAVVLKANSDLSLLYWATYLGGDDGDIGNGIRVDDANNVYVTGTAGHSNFPTTPGTNQSTWPGGEENAYLVKLSSDGSTMLAGTYFGTPDGDEHAYFLDIDEDDNVHIYGQTTGNVDVTPGTYFYNLGSKQYLAAFNADLDAVIYSTVIGTGGGGFGNYGFVPVAFMVDKCNGIYFSGYSAQSGLPTTPDAIATTPFTFYLGKLTPNATALDFGTYYGDSDHVDGGTSRFDKSGVVYQGVCSCTGSILNTLPNAWATTQSGFCDVGVFKIDFDIETVNANGIALPSTSGCAPYDVDFQFTGTNATAFQWLVDGTLVSTDQNYTYTFNDAGTYDVQLVVTNPSACNPTDTLDLQIDVLNGESTLTDTVICGGSTLYLDATTANATYEWQDGSTAATLVTDQPGIYWVDVAIGGCARRDSFVVNSATGVQIDLGPDDAVCDLASILLDISDPGIVSYLWQNGSTDPTFTATGSGVFSVEVVDTAGCTLSDEIELVFGTTPQVDVGPDSILCDGNTLTLTPTSSAGTATWQDGSTSPTYLVDFPGIYWLEVDDAGCKARDSVEVDFLPPITPNEVGIDILCANDCNGVVSASPQGGSGDYMFAWSTGHTTPSVDSLCPGDYTVTITDEEGCTSEAVATVGAPLPLEIGLTTQDVACPGDNDGAIEVSLAMGGIPPYTYAIGNGVFTDVNGAGQLPGGSYEVILQDANGCTVTEVGVIDEPDGFIISAGDDIEIQLGESTQLKSLIVPDFGQDILWLPDDFLECNTCPDPALTPTETTEYLLTVTDPASGCLEIDTVLVTVLKPRNVFIPNAFSPNGDGTNDFFTIYSGVGVERITELRVFDRWGELVFENYNFQPNEPALGWDGMLNGEEMNPAVFAYLAFIEFKDGQIVFFEGDLTLLR